ncbi:MAG: NifB/NifX family molybdenum-iron cluster-binding protein [Candidatus Omnitrophica bacterium]|nr:NifB/NifX family molybdenum-iron cluster-binding protein [Candidatus Omnitrophota bacterium]
MKVAVSSIDKNIESNVSGVFGRCPYFIVAEVKDNKIGEVEILENKSIEENTGAGIATAQLVAENNINVVITGNVGPRALDVLRRFEIEIYVGEGTVQDVLLSFADGKLQKMN